MGLAINEDHLELAASVDGVLKRRDALQANRKLLESAAETLPEWWSEVAELGWLGLHVAERLGGSGYGLAELAIVAEGCGRHLASGPLIPSLVASAALSHADVAESLTRQIDETLSAIATGVDRAGFAVAGDLSLADGVVTGSSIVVSGSLAEIFLVTAGEDLAVVRRGEATTVEVPKNLDPSRRSARVKFDRAPALVLPGQAGVLQDFARLVVAAESAGVAARCTELAVDYIKEREQFGRPVGTFQSVKHHAANMASATELAVSAVWDAAQAGSADAASRSFAAAVAATLAADAVDLCTNLNTQLHGGVAMTWEHDAHLFARRGGANLLILDRDAAARDVASLSAGGVVRKAGIELPPEAEVFRGEVRLLVAEISGMDELERLGRLIETGYVMPHWPEPFGRNASAVEQLVIEEEFKSAGIKRPNYSITAWVLLTLIQYGTNEQVDRWILPGLRRDVVWCQLFSEPSAGSDAAAIQTRGTRVEGGWLVRGQKVWTTGAHVAGFGLATVRTDPGASKHAGITTMVIDMHAEGVTVRPLRQTTGAVDFNEVFFDDVFVPDADVVGEVNAGWTVARATLGNESVSIGGGIDTMSIPASMVLEAASHAGDRIAGGWARVGRYVSLSQGLRLMNLRSAQRAVSGGGPGPEGAISKLMLSELSHQATAILMDGAGAEGLFVDGPAAAAGHMHLMHRAMSIAGGTSEIKRNQIAERILGLPRDPLILN